MTRRLIRLTGRRVDATDRPWARHGRYGGQSAKQRSEARREQLLVAALSLFGTAGYALDDHRAPLPPRPASSRATSTGAFRVERPCSSPSTTGSSSIRSAAWKLPSRRRLPIGGAHGAGVRAFVRSYLDDPRRGRIVCLEVVGVSPALERRRRPGRLALRPDHRRGEQASRASRPAARPGLALHGAGPRRGDSRAHRRLVDRAEHSLATAAGAKKILLVYMATFAGSSAAIAALGRAARDVARTGAR